MQGQPADLGGYYSPTPPRPPRSCARRKTFNAALADARATEWSAYSRRRVQHGDRLGQQDPRRRGGRRRSASAAGSCRASTCTPTSAIRRRERGASAWLRARHDARPLPRARVRRRHRGTSARRTANGSSCRDDDGGLCADGSRRPRRAGCRACGRRLARRAADDRATAGVARGARARHGVRPRAARLPRRQARRVPGGRPRGAAALPRATASPTRAGSCATPTTCCPPTSASVRGSTSSPSSSTSASVEDGQEVGCRAVVTEEWEHKGHRFVRLDVLHTADGRPVARTDHTAIYRPRGT